MHPHFSPTDILDATERKDRLVKFLAENNPSMPIIVCTKQIVRYCPTALCNALGYHIDELNGGDFPLAALVSPSAREANQHHANWVESWFRNPRPLNMHSRGPVPLRKRDGSDLLALVSLVPYIEEHAATHVLSDAVVRFQRYAVAFVLPVPAEWGQ